MKYIHYLDITLGQGLGGLTKLVKYKVKEVLGASTKPSLAPRARATAKEPENLMEKATLASSSSVEETPPISLNK